MKVIKLSQNKETKVDDDDFENLSKDKWYARKDPDSGYYYALGHFGDRKMKYMARVIMNAGSDHFVDHINHDTLDNRKENLRLCNHSENQYNRLKSKYPTSSMHKGVAYNKKQKKWWAYISYNCEKVHLGSFSTEEEAIKIRIEAEKIFHGCYALKTELKGRKNG